MYRFNPTAVHVFLEKHLGLSCFLMHLFFICKDECESGFVYGLEYTVNVIMKYVHLNLFIFLKGYNKMNFKFTSPYRSCQITTK